MTVTRAWLQRRGHISLHWLIVLSQSRYSSIPVSAEEEVFQRRYRCYCSLSSPPKRTQAQGNRHSRVALAQSTYRRNRLRFRLQRFATSPEPLRAREHEKRTAAGRALVQNSHRPSQNAHSQESA